MLIQTLVLSLMKLMKYHIMMLSNLFYFQALNLLPVLNTDNAGSLFNKMSVVGAELLVKTAALIASGNVSPIKQNDADATFCTVLDRESGKLDFSCSAFRLFNLIRGLDPWPSAYFIAGKRPSVNSCSTITPLLFEGSALSAFK